MTRMFIDANVYLEFYVGERSKFREILKTLVNLKDEIFVGSQIVDEVRRNKVDVFLRHAKSFYDKFPTELNLPSFADDEDDAKVVAWKKKRTELKKL